MDEYISREETVKVVCEKCRSYYYHDGHCIHRDACVVGVIQTVPATDVQPATKWISVKDKLPEKAVNVLIYTEYNAIAYGFFTGVYYNIRPLFAITMNRNSKHSWYEENRVSHWMPLPKPPKDGDTNG